MSSAEDIFYGGTTGGHSTITLGCTTTGSTRGPLQAVCTFAPLLMHKYHVIWFLYLTRTIHNF